MSPSFHGGLGDDTYRIADSRAQVVELAGQGVDTIDTWVSLKLPDNVENLFAMTGSAVNLFGNAGNNMIVAGASSDMVDAGAGNDIITGGKGYDLLTGGAGRDIFVYNSAREGGDRITDFHPGEDMLDLRGLIKSVNYPGSNPVADNHLSFTAVRSDTQVSFDADGSGPGAETKIVLLANVTPGALKPDIDFFWH